MGFFDPSHKKMIQRGPSSFQIEAQIWEPMLEAVVARERPDAPDFFRALVVGMLVQRHAREVSDWWDPLAMTSAITRTNNAYKILLPRERELALKTYAEIFEVLEPAVD